MILLADSGTTKCDWIFVDNQRHDKHFEMHTPGLNPSYLTENEITGIINGSNDMLSIKSHVEKIYFFGSGCGSRELQGKMQNILSRIFYKATHIRVCGDVEAAVLACSEGPSVVGILGTGSNACYYDGEKIESRIPSLGYALMDDGGGNSIGKALLRSYFYDRMPARLAESFASEHALDPEKIKTQMYKGRHASQFLASFAPFAFINDEDEFLDALIQSQLSMFFDNHLHVYADELKNYPIHFTGSIAHYSREKLERLCAKHKIQCGKILQRPIIELAHKFEMIDDFLDQNNS